MAENSAISWTDHTFNPWIGCQKVSPACANCYAERDFDHRYGKAKWGANGTRVITSDANWRKPIRWNTDAQLSGNRPRVFCASLADVFEDWDGPIHNSKGDVAYEHSRHGGVCFSTAMSKVRRRLFRLIDATPNLDWLLLTKRPENVRRMWWFADDGGSSVKPRHNVWLGTSVENQEYADKRIPELLKCRDLSPVLFLSCEPLLGPIDLRKVPGMNRVDRSGVVNWIITGGESGPGARPTHPDWFRLLRDQCKAAGVPFHFKQVGEWAWQGEHNRNTIIGPNGIEPADNQMLIASGMSAGKVLVTCIGTKKAGRLLDGELHNDFPFSNH